MSLERNDPRFVFVEIPANGTLILYLSARTANEFDRFGYEPSDNCAPIGTTAIVRCAEHRQDFAVVRVLETFLLDLMRTYHHGQVVFLEKLMRDVRTEETGHFAIVVFPATLSATRIRIAPEQIYRTKTDGVTVLMEMMSANLYPFRVVAVSVKR